MVTMETWRAVKLLGVFTTIAWLSHIVIYFHSRYTHHAELYDQFVSLAESDLCSDSNLMLRSFDVNNCDKAQRVTKGMNLSPLTLSALETLESMSLCGENGLRCYQLITDVKNASLQLTLVLVFLIATAGWLISQKLRIESILSKELPLDSPSYPARVPMYVSQKHD